MLSVPCLRAQPCCCTAAVLFLPPVDWACRVRVKERVPLLPVMTGGSPHAQVEAHASVTAEELAWLTFLHGIIEAAMSLQCRRVVETFLFFTKRECAHYQVSTLWPNVAPGFHACLYALPRGAFCCLPECGLA